jgi:nicotinate-nucleotide adenylyltransferase
VLGGTFDPPHIGHLIVACEALWQLGLDEVRLVPARRPPHKPDATIAPAERRAEWLEQAVAGRAGLSVSRIELEREGPGYTADTLEAMAAGEPGARLWFVLGADQLEGFPGWHDPGRILRLARLAVVGRGGSEPAALAALAERVAPGRADVLDVPPIGVSASMIRARIARGLPVGHLLPHAVEQALVRDGLVPSPSVEMRKEPPRPRSS